MIMISVRSEDILEASVRDFIETGEPVTSERLYRSHNFGIKPAMIRWELNTLSKEGYFYQNHPSGGRIPSDKGYKFFVKRIFNTIEEQDLDELINRETDHPSDVAEYLLEGERRQFVKILADYLSILSLCYEPQTGVIHNSGFNDLFANLDTHEKTDILDVADDFEMIPERLNDKENWWQEETEWPQVFIGRSPFTKSRHLSVVIGRMTTEEPNQLLVLAIGPKRMDYEKSLRLFKYLDGTL